ncbi:hypothetical protein PQX77_006724 [Marasmius sp. AFHP31]|nr:hypothetical protein PQX77_006724 [Marasmius sp. AFHP31]
MPSISPSFLALSAAVLVAIRLFSNQDQSSAPLPPGPKGLPIVGNIREATKRDEPVWFTYADWSRIYGDVFHLKVFGTRTIILNSFKAVTELFEKRSHNYSDRPEMPMTIDLMRWDWNMGFMRYSDKWRLHRRTFHQFFQPRVLPEYYDIQRDATASLMSKLVSSPKNFFQHIRHHSGAIILDIVYGYKLQSDNDPFIKLADDAWAGLKESGNHGSFMVDYLPILKRIPSWLPGAGFRRRANEWAWFTDELKDRPWRWMKKAIEDGTAEPCFSTRNLEKFKITPGDPQHSEMEEVIKNCAAVSLTAGADTTVSAVLSFVAAMVVFPEVQVRAQKELDQVVGPSRLPDFEDRENLPFLNAVLSETLRWNPVTPMSVPHCVVNDDVYDGYLIPGGATIVANVWAILHDEDLYGPNTLAFNPDRFIKKDGKELPPDPEPIAFGFGRRICPGRHLAVNTIWLVMAHLLHTFRMAKEVDSDGKEIEPVIEYSEGLTSHPLPFQCQFIPRSSTVGLVGA